MSQTVPYRPPRSCNAFGRTVYAGNESPQSVDAGNVTAGNLTACRVFDAKGPSVLHLVLSEDLPILTSRQAIDRWGTTYGAAELPFAKNSRWFDSLTGRLVVEETRMYNLECTVHLRSNMATGYRRLSLLWLPAGGTVPVTIAVKEQAPASDTAVPLGLDVCVAPLLSAGDSVWFAVEFPDGVGTVEALAFPYSWFSVST